MFHGTNRNMIEKRIITGIERSGIIACCVLLFWSKILSLLLLDKNYHIPLDLFMGLG